MIELNKIYNEPCLDTISKMDNSSIDCIITSPPYWQLRDYGYNGQWGLESTFQEYLDHLWQMMDGIYRVLKPTGTCWINLGDSYSTQSGRCTAIKNGNDKKWDSTYLKNVGASGNIIKDKNLPNKCLLLLPHRFAIGCIKRGWILRNDCIWAKRNCMPESVTDRFSKKHEYMFFFVKQGKYYFDLNSIKDHTITRDNSVRDRDTTKLNNTPGRSKMGGLKENNYSLKNPGDISDFWDIPTKPNRLKHYATYNDLLLVKPVLAGCPKDGIIYDPFIGTGSTAESAIRSNRKYIGSEMSEEYCKIANNRLTPFLAQQELFQ